VEIAACTPTRRHRNVWYVKVDRGSGDAQMVIVHSIAVPVDCRAYSRQRRQELNGCALPLWTWASFNSSWLQPTQILVPRYAKFSVQIDF
jgi:hypothetical protein